MKRIKDTGKTYPKLSHIEIAKALGASEVRNEEGRIIWRAKMLRKDFDPEVMAWQIIDDKDFDTLVDVLVELRNCRELTKDICCACGIKYARICNVCDRDDRHE